MVNMLHVLLMMGMVILSEVCKTQNLSSSLQLANWDFKGKCIAGIIGSSFPNMLKNRRWTYNEIYSLFSFVSLFVFLFVLDQELVFNVGIGADFCFVFV
jgi:hypothetical protein